MNLVDYIVETFGYNEPFFVKDIVRRLRIEDDKALKSDLEQLEHDNKIYKYANGIYFIPNPNSQYENEQLIEIIKNRLQRKINCGI